MKISLIGVGSIISHGIRSISAYLKKHNHEVKSIFFAKWEYYTTLPPHIFPSLNFQSKLLELVKDSDIIGFSCNSFNSYDTSYLINLLKPLGKPIILGGIHATLSPEDCFKYVNILCIGEGELALLDFVNRLEKGLNIYDTPNFWFKKGDEIVKNFPRPLIEDLDSMPVPDFNFEDQYVFNGKTLELQKPEHFPNVSVFNIYGCPHKCSFCCNFSMYKMMVGKDVKRVKVRKKSIQKMMFDLIQIKSRFKFIKGICIDDDTFFIRPIKEFEYFSNEYKKFINIPFKVYTSPQTLSEKKLQLLIKAGLHSIEMGIQTGSEHINKNIYCRNTTNEQILKASRLINKYLYQIKTPPIYNIIIQNPYENKKDMFETLKLFKQLHKPYVLLVSSLKFFPGTKLHDMAYNDGFITNDDLIIKDLNYTGSIFGMDITKEDISLNDVIVLTSKIVNQKFYGVLPSEIIDYLLEHENLIKDNLKVIISSELHSIIFHEQIWNKIGISGININTILHMVRVISFIYQNEHNIIEVPDEKKSTFYLKAKIEDYEKVVQILYRFKHQFTKHSTLRV